MRVRVPLSVPEETSRHFLTACSFFYPRDLLILDFCSSSINKGESGAIMMRYGVNEVFTLSFDSESKRFSLTQCIGNGVIKFNTFEPSTDIDIRIFIEQILSQIESAYEIGRVW